MKKKNGAVFLELPPTEEGAKLNLSDEIKENCKLVYKMSEDDDMYNFFDVWNPDMEYDEKCVIVPLESTFDGYDYIPANTVIANVEGTTDDPKPENKTWIQMMRDYYNKRGWDTSVLTQCCVNILYYDSVSKKTDKHYHSGCIVGAHVYIKRYSNKSIYLLPLCVGHNNLRKETNIMSTSYGLYAIKLKGCIHN